MRFDGIPDDWSEIEGVIRARAGLIPFGAGRARLTSKDGAREADHFHDVDEIVTARRARARRSTTPSNRPHWKHLSSSRGGRPAEDGERRKSENGADPTGFAGPRAGCVRYITVQSSSASSHEGRERLKAPVINAMGKDLGDQRDAKLSAAGAGRTVASGGRRS